MTSRPTTAAKLPAIMVERGRSAPSERKREKEKERWYGRLDITGHGGSRALSLKVLSGSAVSQERERERERERKKLLSIKQIENEEEGLCTDKVVVQHLSMLGKQIPGITGRLAIGFAIDCNLEKITHYNRKENVNVKIRCKKLILLTPRQ